MKKRLALCQGRSDRKCGVGISNVKIHLPRVQSYPFNWQKLTTFSVANGSHKIRLC